MTVETIKCQQKGRGVRAAKIYNGEGGSSPSQKTENRLP